METDIIVTLLKFFMRNNKISIPELMIALAVIMNEKKD